ncbi:Glutamate synthase domain-containing protein 2 [Methanophagales archaeon]|nr:Glutamate synthase domain-containing protein 2 [Methanophagales archaeon]
MPQKYSIEVIPTPPRHTPIGKFEIERGADCINCGRCAIVCIYEVHKRQEEDLRCMAEPVVYRCKGCFSCIQECPRATLTIREGTDYSRLGDSYWTPEIISKNWYQAETGKIPVSGAGYRGPFSGEGFDSMWTDMSEIVRPTRDGIHGREYISTTVEIGRKLPAIKFDSHGEIVSHIPPTINVPLPIIFDTLPFGAAKHIDQTLLTFDKNVYKAMAMAASYLGTFMIVDAREGFMEAGQKAKGERLEARGEKRQCIPYISQPTLHGCDADWINACKMVELEYEEDVMSVVNEVKTLNPGTTISVRVPFGDNVAGIVEELTYAGIEVIHLYADLNGKAVNQTRKKSLLIPDMTHKVHRHLVDLKIRDDVTLIVSGGIAMAEHVAKAIICGADLTAIDLPLLFALECRYCKDCQEDLACPVELKEVNPEWGAQRIINLIGAWRNQLLEILGAMGLREVRRLRGEVGRAIFVEEIEKDTFDTVFAREVSHDAND